jgi:hypothetical protein
MIRLDDDLLNELGLRDLSSTHRNAVLRGLYEELESRVGLVLAGRMTDEQLDAFEIFIDKNDEEGALGWLEENFPEYPEVVQQEFETLKSEISAQAGAITAVATVYDYGQP